MHGQLYDARRSFLSRASGWSFRKFGRDIFPMRTGDLSVSDPCLCFRSLLEIDALTRSMERGTTDREKRSWQLRSN